MVEGLEQAGAPCVPKFGVGAADVGNGKQVECVEVFACGNTAAEGLEDVRVLDVFFVSWSLLSAATLAKTIDAGKQILNTS